MMNKNSDIVVGFDKIDYTHGRWAIDNSKNFILRGYGTNIKENQQFDPNKENFRNFIDGIRVKNQLYLFRIIYDEILIDFHVLYRELNDFEATYQVQNVAIPEDFISYKNFLIDLIPKAMLYFSKAEDSLKVSNIVMDNFKFDIGHQKRRSYMSKYGPVGPFGYPLYIL